MERCSTVKPPRSTYGVGSPCRHDATFLVTLAIRADNQERRVYFRGYACRYCIRSYRKITGVEVEIERIK